MKPIAQHDFIQSIADSFQFISYYHPTDFVQALGRAYDKEQNPAAKDALAQILTNSRMSAEGHRPLCQDTGIATVFLKVGMNVRWEGATMSVTDMVNEGVRQAYNNTENPLRASVLAQPAGLRKNTKDNTPAVIHYEIIEGSEIEVICAAKGGGSEAKAKLGMLNPSDSVLDWVVKMVPTMGAGWCPPGILGIGIGGTPEKAALLAKQSLMEPVDMAEVLSRGPQTDIEKLRVAIYEA
ncbi:MAG: fumarate hydratase, partial [Burkholderiaceae bacterium]